MGLKAKKYFLYPPLVSGFMVGTSYIPFPPWALLFALVPLFVFWHRQSSSLKINLKTSLWGGFVTGFVLSLIGFNWVAYVAHEFGNLNWALSLGVLFIFCCVGNFYFALAGGVYQVLRHLCCGRLKSTAAKKNWLYLSPLLMGLVLALLEQFFITIFKWNLGYTLLWAGFNSAQLAELVGMQGLSSLIILLQAVVAGWWLSQGQQLSIWLQNFRRSSWLRFKKPAPACPLQRPQLNWAPLIAVLAVGLMCEGAGFWLKHRWPAPDAMARVLMVQGNIGNSNKVRARLGRGSSEYIVDTYIQLTQQNLGALDFALWPETAYPRNLKKTSRQQNIKLYNLVQQVPIVTGGYAAKWVELSAPRPRAKLPASPPSASPPSASQEVLKKYKSTNALFVLQGEGGEVYNKKHLLIFGEYIPFSDRWPKLRSYIPAADFARGDGAKLLPLQIAEHRPNVTRHDTVPQDIAAAQATGTAANMTTRTPLLLGPFICYEALFATYVSRIASLGAHMLVNITNDSWYGDWMEPYQHSTMSLARALETRRPVLRSTNTGFSTVMLATGQQLHTSPLKREWTYVYEVPYRLKPRNTFFQNYPYFTAWLLGLLLIGVLICVCSPLTSRQRS